MSRFIVYMHNKRTLNVSEWIFTLHRSYILDGYIHCSLYISYMTLYMIYTLNRLYIRASVERIYTLGNLKTTYLPVCRVITLIHAYMELTVFTITMRNLHYHIREIAVISIANDLLRCVCVCFLCVFVGNIFSFI
jgi:hypothetical protein